MEVAIGKRDMMISMHFLCVTYQIIVTQSLSKTYVEQNLISINFSLKSNQIFQTMTE